MSESTINSSLSLTSAGAAETSEVDTLTAQLSEADLDPTVHFMLTRLAGQEEPHFRHQFLKDAPLTPTEKVSIGAALLRKNPGEFLARYSRYLTWPEDAECFQEQVAAGDFTVRFYLNQAGVKLSRNSSPTTSASCQRLRRMRVKNRRLQVLQRMLVECGKDPTAGFFSHEEMRERDPELWEAMVGRYLITQDRRALLGHSYESFSGLLLSQLLESESAVQRKLATADGAISDNEDGEQMEEEFDSDDDVGIEEAKQRRQLLIKRKAAEGERSQAEFFEIMKSRFLAGEDSNFDYRSVDNDDSLDDAMEESWRDAEESYFDAESPCQAENLEETTFCGDQSLHEKAGVVEEDESNDFNTYF